MGKQDWNKYKNKKPATKGVRETLRRYPTHTYSPLHRYADGQAFKDGTIEVDPNLSPLERKKTIAHEMKHVEDMEKNGLDYDSKNVMFKGKKYPRKDGNIKYNGKWLVEGDPSLPWEARAHAAENPFVRSGEQQKTKRRMPGDEEIDSPLKALPINNEKTFNSTRLAIISNHLDEGKSEEEAIRLANDSIGENYDQYNEGFGHYEGGLDSRDFGISDEQLVSTDLKENPDDHPSYLIPEGYQGHDPEKINEYVKFSSDYDRGKAGEYIPFDQKYDEDGKLLPEYREGGGEEQEAGAGQEQENEVVQEQQSQEQQSQELSQEDLQGLAQELESLSVAPDIKRTEKKSRKEIDQELSSLFQKGGGSLNDQAKKKVYKAGSVTNWLLGEGSYNPDFKRTWATINDDFGDYYLGGDLSRAAYEADGEFEDVYNPTTKKYTGRANSYEDWVDKVNSAYAEAPDSKNRKIDQYRTAVTRKYKQQNKTFEKIYGKENSSAFDRLDQRRQDAAVRVAERRGIHPNQAAKIVENRRSFGEIAGDVGLALLQGAATGAANYNSQTQGYDYSQSGTRGKPASGQFILPDSGGVPEYKAPTVGGVSGGVSSQYPQGGTSSQYPQGGTSGSKGPKKDSYGNIDIGGSYKEQYERAGRNTYKDEYNASVRKSSRGYRDDYQDQQKIYGIQTKRANGKSLTRSEIEVLEREAKRQSEKKESPIQRRKKRYYNGPKSSPVKKKHPMMRKSGTSSTRSFSSM